MQIILYVPKEGKSDLSGKTLKFIIVEKSTSCSAGVKVAVELLILKLDIYFLVHCFVMFNTLTSPMLELITVLW